MTLPDSINEATIADLVESKLLSFFITDPIKHPISGKVVGGDRNVVKGLAPTGKVGGHECNSHHD